MRRGRIAVKQSADQAVALGGAGGGGRSDSTCRSDQVPGESLAHRGTGSTRKGCASRPSDSGSRFRQCIHPF